MKILSDLHVHTHLSLCARSSAVVPYYIDRAKELGIKRLGFSDHMWDAPIEGRERSTEFYSVQNFEHILKLKEEIKSAESFDILFGCETEYSKSAGAAITEETAKQLDFLLVPNSHTHITADRETVNDHEKHAEYMLKAFYDIINCPVSKYITAIAHPFYAVCCPYDNRELFGLYSDEDFRKCFSAAKEKNIAMEINTSCFAYKTLPEIYADPSLRMYEIAKQCGCKFTFGSDSHSIHDHDSFYKAYIISSILELTENDLHPLSIC